MKPLSILVADDTGEIQQLMRHWLGELGHTVTCASSGSEAAELVRSRPFDLVITDIIMPDGDGLELIGEVRKRRPEARVIAVSGGGVYLHASACLTIAQGLGAKAVLKKPFNKQQFLDALERACPSDSVAVQ